VTIGSHEVGFEVPVITPQDVRVPPYIGSPAAGFVGVIGVVGVGVVGVVVVGVVVVGVVVVGVVVVVPPLQDARTIAVTIKALIANQRIFFISSPFPFKFLRFHVGLMSHLLLL